MSFIRIEARTYPEDKPLPFSLFEDDDLDIVLGQTKLFLERLKTMKEATHRDYSIMEGDDDS